MKKEIETQSVFASGRDVMDARREFKPGTESNKTLEPPQPVETTPDDGVDRSLDARREAREREALVKALATHGVSEVVVEEVPYESPLNQPEAMQRAKEHYYGLPNDAHNLGQLSADNTRVESNREIS